MRSENVKNSQKNERDIKQYKRLARGGKIQVLYL